MKIANALNTDKKITIIAALSVGSSIRAIDRMTGVHRDTIMRLAVRIGQGCTVLMDFKLRDLPCKHLERVAILQELRALRAMPKKSKPEPRKPGRPKLAEEHAKGRIVPVRFNTDEVERIAKAAQKSNKTVSKWIRCTLATAMEG